METGNRKLIRPSLVEMKEQANANRRNNHQGQGQGHQGHQGPKRSAPPDQTNAENFYYLKQMQARTPMVFVLNDGETLEGVIEWYDKACLKIKRDDEPNLLLYKPAIKYMYKANQG